MSSCGADQPFQGAGGRQTECDIVRALRATLSQWFQVRGPSAAELEE